MGVNVAPAVPFQHSNGCRRTDIGIAVNSSTTPLISLRAVAIDTETTGLDARTARIVEIAAVRVNGLEVEGSVALQQLVRPDVPVPESASRIHGLAAHDLEASPRFADIGLAPRDVMNTAVVIGHNVGYDLAVLDREYARAGLEWIAPRSLDVRALARLAALIWRTMASILCAAGSGLKSAGGTGRIRMHSLRRRCSCGSFHS